VCEAFSGTPGQSPTLESPPSISEGTTPEPRFDRDLEALFDE
jgi:hypothetical protein